MVPLYNYRCTVCQTETELMRPVGWRELPGTCESCGGSLKYLLGGASLVGSHIEKQPHGRGGAAFRASPGSRGGGSIVGCSFEAPIVLERGSNVDMEIHSNWFESDVAVQQDGDGRINATGNRHSASKKAKRRKK